MNIIRGNLLDIEKGIIIHQVNNKRKMGAGLALEIRKRYPKHYDDYMASMLEMGSLVKTSINSKFGVIGIVAQDGYGTDKCYTDYKAFEKGLLEIKKLHELKPAIEFYMPYRIGCNLAGGNWLIVGKLIETITPFVVVVSKD